MPILVVKCIVIYSHFHTNNPYGELHKIKIMNDLWQNLEDELSTSIPTYIKHGFK